MWFEPEDDLVVEPDRATADIVAFYRRARAAADRVIDDLPVDTLGTSWAGETVSLRWVLIHMVEETARHAGHMDIVRELIDGAHGDHPER
jgi:hypothetical protein